jgi:hypothetical protein
MPNLAAASRIQTLTSFRQFYLAFPSPRILSTPSLESSPPIVSTASIESQRKKSQTSSGELPVRDLAARFPLPWSRYVRLLSTKNAAARRARLYAGNLRSNSL